MFGVGGSAMHGQARGVRGGWIAFRYFCGAGSRCDATALWRSGFAVQGMARDLIRARWLGSAAVVQVRV